MKKKILVVLFVLMIISASAFAAARKPTGDYGNSKAQSINQCYGNTWVGCVDECVQTGKTYSECAYGAERLAGKCQDKKCL